MGFHVSSGECISLKKFGGIGGKCRAFGLRASSVSNSFRHFVRLGAAGPLTLYTLSSELTHLSDIWGGSQS